MASQLKRPCICLEMQMQGLGMRKAQSTPPPNLIDVD